LPLADAEQEGAGLAGREAGLKQQLLEDAVVVGVDGLHEQFLAGVLVVDMHFANVVHREQLAEFRGLEHDGLAGPRQGDGIAHDDGGAGRGGQAGPGGCQSKEDGKREQRLRHGLPTLTQAVPSIPRCHGV